MEDQQGVRFVELLALVLFLIDRQFCSAAYVIKICKIGCEPFCVLVINHFNYRISKKLHRIICCCRLAILLILVRFLYVSHSNI